MGAVREHVVMRCNSCKTVGSVEENFYECSCCGEIFCVLCLYEMREKGVTGNVCPTCIEEVYMVGSN